MRIRSARATGVLWVVFALAATALSSPALGAKPAGAVGTAVAQPGTVSAGEPVAFNLTFTNNGPSNISALYLVADTPPGSQFIGVPIGPSVGSCPNTDGKLLCTFGSVPATTPPITITLTAVYVTPSPLDGDWTVPFHFNSTGTTGGNSHGNDIAAPAGTVHVTTDSNFAGRYVVNADQLTIGDDTTPLSKSNKQSTVIDASATGQTLISLTAQDGKGVAPPTIQTGDDCGPSSTQIGEWSALNVGDDTTFTNPFRVTVSVYQGANPNQVSGLCWIYLDKVTGKVTGQFLSNPANLCDSLTSPSVTPCFSLTKPGNNLQVVFISRHNGLIHLSP